MQKSIYSFIGFVALTVATAAFASFVQQDFGRVAVSNVVYANKTGTRIRAKLYRPSGIDSTAKAPGIVYVHGYQNNRDTSDPFCIETARRGMVTLCIDAIGRGNSGFPSVPGTALFDKTYGTAASVAYLRRLNYVDPSRIGLMGNSLGGELVYEEALADPTVSAVAFSGFALDNRAERYSPGNMLMIFGAQDEYRTRMLGTSTVDEWLARDLVQRVTGEVHPKASTTYGSLAKGDARRIEFPSGSHLAVSHSLASVAAAVDWMRSALHPTVATHLDSDDQIWPLKEWACLLTMLFGFATLFPLVSVLLRLRFFSSLVNQPMTSYTASRRETVSCFAINGLLMWLYLPLVMTLYAVHLYIVHIDGIFPMMITNGIVFWFFTINVIGLLFFRRQQKRSGRRFCDLGLTFSPDLLRPLQKTVLLAALLFAVVYTLEHVIEHCFLVDYRFIFPFASDLTPERALLGLRYYPFIWVGFLGTGVFLHVQLKRPPRATGWKTFLDWSAFHILALIWPIVIMLAIQYLPVYFLDTVPLVGPGGAFVSFIMNLIHVVGVLILCVPISTWCFMKTKTPYLGAFLNAALVTWMFASSQVVAPIPL